MANKSKAFRALETDNEYVREENYKTQYENRRLRWKITAMDDLLQKITKSKFDKNTLIVLKKKLKADRLKIINNTTSERY